MARHMQRMRMQLKPESLGLTQAEDSEGSQDEAEVEDGQEANTPFNPFDLLNPEEDGVFSEPDGEQSDGAGQGLREGDSRAGTDTVSKSSTKRKRKKKKGKDQKAVVSEPSEGQGSIDKAEDEIDRIVREVMATSIAAAGPAAGSAADSERVRSGQATSTSSVLVVEPRALRPEEELKAMFGADVIAAEAREAADEERRRRGARNPKGVRGLNTRGRMLRKLILYQPREQWLLRVDEGISMECLGSQNGRIAFRYRFTPAYEAVQKAFEGQAASHDPNVVAALLDRCPYHLDGLLAMHHLCQAMGEGEYAEAMLNRCLHVLELAWHPTFKPAGGACALPYEHRENRVLFTALHLHIRGLTRRGCHRTALEFSKLLLGLDHQDPVGALFLVDYLALRSREYEFLHRLADAPQLQHSGSLRLLPGLSFSLALATFYQQRQRGGGGGGGGEAQDALMQAVLTFPCQVTALLRKIRDRGGGKDARWTSVLAHRLFARADAHGSDTLAHLTLLYAERCHALWEPSDVLQGLLYAACFACTEVVDGTRSWRGGAPPESWARVCSEAYPPSGTNDFRHVRLADMSDSSGALPREEVEAAMAGADDLDLAALVAQQQQQQQQGGGGVRVDTEELQAAHPLVMLLRSLLPWVDAGIAPDSRDAAGDPPA